MKVALLVTFCAAWLLCAIVIAAFDVPIWVVWTEVLAPIAALLAALVSQRTSENHFKTGKDDNERGRNQDAQQP